MMSSEIIWRVFVCSQTGYVTGRVACYYNTGHVTGCLVSPIIRLVMCKFGHILVVQTLDMKWCVWLYSGCVHKDWPCISIHPLLIAIL